MTDRLLRAIAMPVGRRDRPSARAAIVLRREPHKADMTQVIRRGGRGGRRHGDQRADSTRLDLDDLHARRARDAGVRIVISSDAHSVHGLSALRWGVTVARRAWLTPADVLNTRSVARLHRRAWTRRNQEP